MKTVTAVFMTDFDSYFRANVYRMQLLHKLNFRKFNYTFKKYSTKLIIMNDVGNEINERNPSYCF